MKIAYVYSCNANPTLPNRYEGEIEVEIPTDIESEDALDSYVRDCISEEVRDETGWWPIEIDCEPANPAELAKLQTWLSE